MQDKKTTEKYKEIPKLKKTTHSESKVKKHKTPKDNIIKPVKKTSIFDFVRKNRDYY